MRHSWKLWSSALIGWLICTLGNCHPQNFLKPHHTPHTRGDVFLSVGRFGPNITKVAVFCRYFLAENQRKPFMHLATIRQCHRKIGTKGMSQTVAKLAKN